MSNSANFNFIIKDFPGKKAYRVRDWRGGGAGLPAFGGEAGAEAEPRKARWHKVVPHPRKF